MAQSISDLIRKRYPNGRDLGELFVDTTIKDIESWRKEKNVKHPYTQEMLNKAFYELPPEGQKVFNTYADIHDTLIAIYDRNQAYLQQFYNGFYRVKYTLDEIFRNETFYNSNVKYKSLMEKDAGDEFSKNLKNELLRVSTLKKAGRVGEIEKAYALMDDALWDFAACKMYLDTAETLYSLSFRKVCDSYFEEAADKADELSVLFDKTLEISKDLEKFFKKININDYHLDLYETMRGERDASLKKWKKDHSDTNSAEMNSYIKRYKPQIETIKATLKSGNKLKGFGD